MINILRSRAASMAFGSLVYQGAGFVIILALKDALEAQDFAFFVTQLAWASIFGSVATFRLELLLFQEKEHVDRANLVTTLTFTIGFLVLVGLAFSASAAVLGGTSLISWFALFLALGFALHEAQSFLCVQMGQIPELILTRVLQAVGLLVTGYISWSGQIGLSETIVFYALSIVTPIFIWFMSAIIHTKGRASFLLPPRNTWGRSLYLVFATLVNTVYANLAIVIASSTQSAAFAADFGFIMKLLVGPISLIRQAFGHTFIVDAFAIDRRASDAGRLLHTLLNQTVIKCLKAYIAILVPVFLVLWFGAGFFAITQKQIILWLALSSIMQVMINPVAGIRTPLKREFSFLVFDVIRTLALTAALLAPLALPFEAVFSITSALLYGSYFVFIRYQVSLMSISSTKR